MSARIMPPDTAFSVVRQRRPRQKAGGHLNAIRRLPCLICGSRPVEAAHIRMGYKRYGKRDTGAGEKPSDMWTLPLCEACHRTGPGAQHTMSEALFYWTHGIKDPFAIALALWSAQDDEDTMLGIIRAAKDVP